MPNTKVSIITPVYNAAPFLDATIRSIQAQTHRDWELLVVDDCSTDNSVAIIKAYAQQDARIKLLKNDKNQGQIATRNKAIKAASGRFIAYLDSDDIWKANKLEKQVQFLIEKEATFVHAYYEYIDEKGTALNKVIKAPFEIDYKKLLNTNYIGCLTAMYDTQKVEKMLMPYVGKRDDWACWLNILKQGHKAYCLPEILAAYRVGHNSLSSNKLEMAKYNWGILRQNQGLSIFKAAYHFSMYFYLSIKKYYFHV